MASTDILLLEKSYHSFIGFIESNADTEDTKNKLIGSYIDHFCRNNSQ